MAAVVAIVLGAFVLPAGGVDVSVWTTHQVPQPNQWRDVTFGNGVFVAISVAPPPYQFPEPWMPVMTSTDGITWTARSAPAANWVAVTFGAGQFVAVGDGATVMTSPDGITWTEDPAAPAPASWTDVTYGNGQFVAVGLNPSAPAMTSPDGVNWTIRSTPDGQWNGIAYGNGTFVATGTLGGSNQFMTSPDGIAWTGNGGPATLGTTGVAYGNGRFVSAAYNTLSGNVLTSTDGITWDQHDGPIGYSTVFADGAFLNTGSGVVNSSTDGVVWTSYPVPEEAPAWALAYGNGVVVGVANGSTAIRSGPLPPPAPLTPATVQPTFTG